MSNSDYMWTVHYALNNDCKSITTFTMKAVSAFNEKGRYNLEEAKRVVDFLNAYPIPDFRNDPDHSRWYRFTEVLNQKIYELYNK